ncbi:VWA domain-containing protein [Neptuniibacter sp. 1_MG-2023]|uniref:VWA domain-containing protein n=1 Tax=Neptuniibacter sp. 1_MG-2023 TaxID=3062662 RepID=UPI0026E481C4|nr:VWA domain-containing protein [Neptuniibacter sp. 1_MG-2023]MDO6594702.1 VWA domain-containing protein [Neptuniibacter sp. 1_MG-2023]
MLADFHFLQPYWLLLIPVVLVLAYFTVNKRINQTHWQAVCDPELLPFLEQKGEERSPWLPISLLIAALILIVAAAQPVWKKQPQPVFKQGDALVIALDLSASMNAEDIKPSRLQRARFKIEDLLRRMPDAEVALLVYAADAFSVTPLTDDSDTILAQLPAMTPEIMPAQGSRADKAIALADQLLSQAGISQGNILLISDEVLPVQIAATATRLRSQGRQISILAVGTEQGAPVKTERGVLKDQNGQIVIAKTQADLMQESASLGGGEAQMITADDRDINNLIAQFQRGDQRPTESNEKIDRWVSEGPWFVLLALPLVLMVFRKGILALLMPLLLPSMLFMAMGHSGQLQADPIVEGVEVSAPVNNEGSLWKDLWQTQDQQALELYRSGDKQSAAAKFKNPHWKQLAHYESQQYEQALDALGEPETAADWYNQGNILTRLGALDTALSAYEKALKMKPDFDDALHNKEVVEQLLQQQEQANKNDNDQSKSDQKEGASQEDHAESTDAQGANSQDSEGQTSKNESSQGGGPQEGSSQNGNAQNGGFDDQSKASKQHAKNNMSGDQGSSGDGQNNDEQTAANEQLQQAVKNKIDQQLKNEAQKASALNKAEDQNNDPAENMSAQGSQQDRQPLDEEQQARQQLLNRVEDDPAGLWRRKFIYQYRQQPNGQAVEEKQW